MSAVTTQPPQERERERERVFNRSVIENMEVTKYGSTVNAWEFDAEKQVIFKQSNGRLQIFLARYIPVPKSTDERLEVSQLNLRMPMSEVLFADVEGCGALPKNVPNPELQFGVTIHEPVEIPSEINVPREVVAAQWAKTVKNLVWIQNASIDFIINNPECEKNIKASATQSVKSNQGIRDVNSPEFAAAFRNALKSLSSSHVVIDSEKLYERKKVVGTTISFNKKPFREFKRDAKGAIIKKPFHILYPDADHMLRNPRKYSNEEMQLASLVKEKYDQDMEFCPIPWTEKIWELQTLPNGERKYVKVLRKFGLFEKRFSKNSIIQPEGFIDSYLQGAKRGLLSVLNSGATVLHRDETESGKREAQVTYEVRDEPPPLPPAFVHEGKPVRRLTGGAPLDVDDLDGGMEENDNGSDAGSLHEQQQRAASAPASGSRKRDAESAGHGIVEDITDADLNALIDASEPVEYPSAGAGTGAGASAGAKRRK